MKRNIWLDGIMGVLVGDALGMPVQFLDRKDVRKNPITTMRGYGTFNKPPGTWSDDGSMTLATLDSIVQKKHMDYDDIMHKFIAWYDNGAYTQGGQAFDQGITCTDAIWKYKRNRNVDTCGKTGQWANGNGALMRILPVCLYAYIRLKDGTISLDEALDYVHQTTALTHNHLRAKIASGIYFFLIQAILDRDGSLIRKMQMGMDNARAFYGADSNNADDWAHYKRLDFLVDFAMVPDSDIKSSGYVVDSLEAAIWALITTDTFADALLRAVNLGDDADTVGAIAGGLAALHYGYNGIPADWMDAIYDKDSVIDLCQRVRGSFYV